MLTEEERDKLNRSHYAVLLGFALGVAVIPYSFYLVFKARQNPAMRTTYVRRIILLPLYPLGFMLYNGWRIQTQMKHLSDKYFSYLSD